MPLAVKVVGWAHGALFVTFLAMLAWTMTAARWPIGRGALVLVAALLPFGPFIVDRRMKAYLDEFEHAPAVTSSAGRPMGSRT
jgi:integral membrane protein